MAQLDLDDLIDGAREVDRPSSEQADRLFEAIVDGVGPPPPELTEPHPTPGVDGALTSAAGKVTGAPLLLLGGGIVGLGIATALLTSSVEKTKSPELSPSVIVQPQKEKPVETQQLTQDSGFEPEAPSKEPLSEPSKKRKPSPQVAPQDSLAAEVALIRQAKVAFNEKNYQKALAHLDRHREQFPHGKLKGEAQATRVLVLCALKQGTRANKEAARLDENSPLGEKMKTRCKAK